MGSAFPADHRSCRSQVEAIVFEIKGLRLNATRYWIVVADVEEISALAIGGVRGRVWIRTSASPVSKHWRLQDPESLEPPDDGCHLASWAEIVN